MSAWDSIYKKDNISVGMWVGDDKIFFTLEELNHEDIEGQDVEFAINLKDLEQIMVRAMLGKI